MDISDFDQVAQILFNEISSFPRSYYPSVLVPLTEDTRAVLAGDSSTNVFIVAAKHGQGRCLVFGEQGYATPFLKKIETYAKFVENCRNWLTVGQGGEFFSIDKFVNFKDITTEGKILVWNGHHEKSQEFMDELLNYVENGGNIVCAANASHWMSTTKSKDLSKFGFAHFCEALGVRVVGRCGAIKSPVAVKLELVTFQNIQRAVKNILQNSNDHATLSVIAAAAKEFGSELPTLSAEVLENILQMVSLDSSPCKSCPLKDEACKNKSSILCELMCGIPGCKAPNVNIFPGDFENKPNFLDNIEISINAASYGWDFTGYYVAPGVPVRIEVLEVVGPAGWIARIGCHTDNLRNCKEIRRWPCIFITKPLVAEKCIEIHSPYGGLLFFEGPKVRSGSIRAQISSVVLAPSYDLDDPNRAEKWKDMQSNAPGLWANIAGRYIVFNFPSKSVLHMSDQELDEILEIWDAVVVAHNDLRGTSIDFKQRIVCDEQASAGYMHSGYPVVTHLDVCDPKRDKFLLKCDVIKNSGNWGLFHEIGHNMQRGWWTFSNTREVTVNIFTLHAMDKVCNKPTWLHSSLAAHLGNAKKHIEQGAKFSEWGKQPFVALFVYAQLVREFGWDAYKQVFRQYEQEKPALDTDQKKMDHWIIKFSKQVGKNLVPLFKFWDWPISESTINELSGLEIAKIDDELIQVAPSRYSL